MSVREIALELAKKTVEYNDMQNEIWDLGRKLKQKVPDVKGMIIVAGYLFEVDYSRAEYKGVAEEVE